MRTRSVALVTRDPALYHELAGFLRERRLPAISLFPGDRIPDRVAVVLTSAEERARIDHPRVLVAAEGGDRRALGAAIAHALGSTDPAGELIVGIDPGPRPGYAIVVGSTCLGEGNLDGPEAVAGFVAQLRHRFPDRPIRFRVGAGHPPSRNRLVNLLVRKSRSVELVNESGTTPRGRRRPRDAEAARRIAASPGVPIHEPLVASITPGEIADLQRLSREGSGGRLTISRRSADRVLRGELSLAEALDQAMPSSKPVGPPSGPSRLREPL